MIYLDTMVLLLIVIYLLCLVKFRVYSLFIKYGIINDYNSFIFAKFGILFSQDLFLIIDIILFYNLFINCGMICCLNLIQIRSTFLSAWFI